MGSGYPADKYTIKFLDAYFEKYNQFEPYVRKSWDTIMRYEKDKQQSGLDDFWSWKT